MNQIFNQVIKTLKNDYDKYAEEEEKYPLFLQEKKIDIMGGELQERFENSQQQKATNGIPRRKNATSKIKNLLNRINSSSNNGMKLFVQ